MERFQPKAAIVLVIEDDANDASLLQFAAVRFRSRLLFHIVSDEPAVKGYLTGNGKYADRGRFPLPDLILLDLNFPGMDTFRFLEWKRGEATLKTIPVSVWSGTPVHEREEQLRSVGVVRFFEKPHQLGGFKAVVDALAELL